jgi:hypothetical protein
MTHFIHSLYLSYVWVLFFQTSTGSIRNAVENVIQNVGDYPQGASADISLPCAQTCRSSPLHSSSHVSVLSQTNPAPTTENTTTYASNARRTISTQTGRSIQRDFFYVNNWLDHCRVSTLYIYIYKYLIF